MVRVAAADCGLPWLAAVALVRSRFGFSLRCRMLKDPWDYVGGKACGCYLMRISGEEWKRRA